MFISEDIFRQAVEKKSGKVLGEYKNSNTLVLCTCSSGHIFCLRPIRFLTKHNWCNLCSHSRGEKKIEEILTELRINYIREYHLPRLGHFAFDFFFRLKNKKYLIEYDGIQHFRVTNFSSGKELEKRQRVDKLKERIALENGYHVIRIDYTQFYYIKEHIEEAIRSENKLYYSSEIYC